MWHIFRAFKPKPEQMRSLMISFALTKQRKIFAPINLDINFKTIYIFLNRTLSAHTHSHSQSQAHAKDLSGDPKPINKSFIAKSTRRAKLIKTSVSFSVSIACFFLPLSWLFALALLFPCSVDRLYRSHASIARVIYVRREEFGVKLKIRFQTFHICVSISLTPWAIYSSVDRSIEREMNPLTLTHCLTFHQSKPNLCGILSRWGYPKQKMETVSPKCR